MIDGQTEVGPVAHTMRGLWGPLCSWFSFLFFFFTFVTMGPPSERIEVFPLFHDLYIYIYTTVAKNRHDFFSRKSRMWNYFLAFFALFLFEA